MSQSLVIYLIRAAATEDSVILNGCMLNPRLSRQGTAQARRMYAFFKKRGLTAIYSSPLLRALETAQIIAKGHDAVLRMRQGLAEADYGLWEGLSWDDVQKHHCQDLSEFLHNPGECGCSQGENLTEVQDRGLKVFAEICRRHAEGRILVVAHTQLNRAVLCHMLGLSLSRARELDQRPGCINVIRVVEGETTVEAVDRCLEYDEELLMEED
jgi:broad specificity phosphatase PhoE